MSAAVPVDQVTETERLAAGMGSRIRTLGIASGYNTSVAAYARYLGLPVSTVRRCEAGRLVSTSRCYAVMYAASERGVSLDWFLIGDIRSGGFPRIMGDLAGKVVNIGRSSLWLTHFRLSSREGRTASAWHRWGSRAARRRGREAGRPAVPRRSAASSRGPRLAWAASARSRRRYRQANSC
jgi:hypothetical protein